MQLYEVFGKPGGSTFKTTNVQRIDKNRVATTIEYISRLTGITTKDLHKVGSTGKTKSSGDIDLAVESGKYDFDSINQRLRAKLGEENISFDPNTRIASYSVPIMRKSKGELVHAGGNVQVDLAFVPNVDWAKFSYHSESGSSNKPTAYKGAIRTALLKSIASTLSEEGIDKVVYEPSSGDLIIRIGRSFDLNRGLRRIFQVRPERKRRKEGQSQYLSNMRTVDTIDDLKPAIDALKKQYPKDFDSVEIDADDREITINDPDDFLKILFPGKPTIKQDDVRTAEDIIRLIKTRFDAKQRKEIVNNVKESTRRLHTKMRVPEWDDVFQGEPE